MKCFLLAFYFAIAIGGSVCMQGCTDPSCEQQLSAYKNAMGTTNNSPYIGGTGCCDPEILPYIHRAGSPSTQGRRRRQAINFTIVAYRKWTPPIYYTFTSNINAAQQTTVQKAVSYMQSQTCIKFQQLTTLPTPNKYYINIDIGTNCVTFIGRNNVTITPLEATSDCLNSFGAMLNLLTQTLGVFQENQRPDSSNYITIQYANVVPVHNGDFITVNYPLLVTYGLPYDFSSITHLPANIFSTNGQPTIRTNDPLYQQTIGQRVQLSFLDSKLINTMYCTATCSSPAPNCKNGGYQDPNACTQCRCPDGYAGTLCDQTDQPETCSGILVATPTAQSIMSPGYPNPGYPTDSQLKCVWQITAPKGGQIKLQFVDAFGIYCYTNSCYHWVEVRYQTPLNNTGPRFCCSKLPMEILISSGPQALIIFQSNDTVPTQYPGFQLQYSVINAPACAYVTCNNGGTCVNDLCVCPSGWTGVNCKTVSPVSSGNTCPTPNPCHNNGNCTLNATSPLGYTCSCPPGVTGPQCQSGCCGGCSADSLYLEQMCTMNAVPYQLCNVTMMGGSSSYEEGWRRKHNTRQRMSQTPCTKNFCCDNAQIVGPPGGLYCAVTGWSNWTQCSAFCGGGISQRYNVTIVQAYNQWQNLYYNWPEIVKSDTQSVYCNTLPCVCQPQQSRWRFWQQLPCSPCTDDFQLVKGACTPNTPLLSPSGSGTSGSSASAAGSAQ